ncbi:MAG TPA: pitrilysin family protein [Myxococcota bacterium]|nr:pitrilysin family protein [Myxococcota bacterium]
MVLAQDTGLGEEPVEEPVEYGPIERGLTHTTLESGLTVSVYSDPEMPVVATQMWVHVGSAHELDGERGLAHLFEHLVFSAPPDAGPASYSRYHVIHGGYKNAWTSKNSTAYVSEIAPQYHDEVLRMGAEHFLSIDPDEATLDREKKVVAEELRMSTTNDPLARMFVELQTKMWEGHPYERSPVGTLDDIDNFTMENVATFSERYYRADNMHLVVSGPVHGQETIDKVGELYAELPGGAAEKTNVPDTLTWDFPAEVDVTEDIPPIRAFGLAYPLPSLEHEDAAAVEVMLDLVSGDEVNLFRKQLVEVQKGALEGSGAGAVDRSGGMFMFLAITLPLGSPDRTWAEMDEALGVLGEGAWLDAEALARVTKRMRRELLLDVYYADEMAERIGWAQRNRDDAQLAFSRADEIAGVTLEDIARVWETYVTNGTPVRIYAHKE